MIEDVDDDQLMVVVTNEYKKLQQELSQLREEKEEFKRRWEVCLETTYRLGDENKQLYSSIKELEERIGLYRGGLNKVPIEVLDSILNKIEVKQ